MTADPASPGGFWLPYRYADAVTPPEGPGAYPALEPFFREAEPAFHALLRAIAGLETFLSAIGPDDPPEPRWNQDWFTGFDAAALYALVHARRPARIVEIGSGHSTRFAARAVRDHSLATRITAIDPAPRATIDGLAPVVEAVRSTVQQAGTGPFEELGAGDMVFVDSSHLLVAGSDVDRLLTGILPRLAPGVLVHVHDVFLPDGYPPEWRWRAYNEQSAFAPLLYGGGWRLVWGSRYVRTQMAETAAHALIGRLGVPSSALESSLWLERDGGHGG